MKKRKINLQLFSDGGGAAAGASGAGSDGGMAVTESGVNASPEANGDDLSKVIYGKADEELTTPDTKDAPQSLTAEDKTKAFENMIKKNGEYHEEFAKKTQDIIDKRFAKSKQLEDRLNAHTPIMELLSMKYGIDANDPKAILEAIEADDSLFEQQAYEQGLTTEKYREMLKLERENRELKAAREAREAETASNEIYAKWESDANAMCQKYGIQNFDLSVESQNPDFTRLLASGVDLETAYMVIHRDDVMNSAMAVSARETKKALVNNLQTMSMRPNESATISSANNAIFKSDPSKFSDKDMDEIIRRVANGERIVL